MACAVLGDTWAGMMAQATAEATLCPARRVQAWLVGTAALRMCACVGAVKCLVLAVRGSCWWGGKRGGR